MAADLALLLFAFTAGAAAFFAPCCVAMLPAYVAYAVRPHVGEAEFAPRRVGATGTAIALIGLLPLTVGVAALMLRGLGTMNLLPYEAYLFLPTLDLSLTLLLLGGGGVILGLTLAGKGVAARRGLAFGGLATLGSFVTFIAIGAPIALLARGISPYLSWLSVAVGVGIVVLGMMMLLGRTLSPRIPTLTADVSRPSGFFKFGVAYGIAGLSCTFPVFLAVIGSGLIAGGFGAAVATFAAYAVGKSSVLAAVTTVTVAGSAEMGVKMNTLARPITRASAWMLILAGVYMTYYFGRLIVLVGG